jgi:Ner family transcriptional regulator
MSTSSKVIFKAKKPVTQDWHRADIICGLWKLGTSVQRLSKLNNYAPTALGMTLGRPWPKGERIIADALGVPVQQIWPSRYHPDGSPKSGRGERGIGRYKTKHTAAGAAVNDHFKVAA